MPSTPPEQKPTADEIISNLRDVIGQAKGKERMADFADAKRAIDFLNRLSRPKRVRVIFALAQLALIGLSIGGTLLYQYGSSPQPTRTHDWVLAVAITIVCAVFYALWVYEEES